ncbi:alpha-L-fucosidase 2 [Paenibacillus sp. UNCCL117]|uniref:glycosyl hydrolase family 95 catalytic domain-containing protein n=1 Tax=unclassified Paenibacillus TaxID=185978 RepID=UPI00088E333E|nr:MULTISPECIES: glycoside hydrolase N-terminal domain-containing protein [unclassified Paenibacillus]SDD59515.1 alpha-L-fucosidase 2 [Paenibacillus sp. cl123]SFW50791.1 alpha-L-fucosidase 2 [Paenibacillus sp. UNCCL117]
MKHRIIMKYPASWWRSLWREALPCGNGKIGAAVYGGIHEERILLNHEELWRGGQSPVLPDVSDRVPEARRLLEEGDVLRADRILSNALKESGYNPKMASPLPLGDLMVYMPLEQPFRSYRRELDMGTGEAAVRWTDGATRYERKLFVSRTDDAVVMEIGKQGPASVEARLQLQLHDKRDCRRPEQVVFPKRDETKYADGFLYYAAEHEDGSDFGAVARIVSRGANASAEKTGLGESDGVQIAGAESVLVLLKVFTRGQRVTEWERLRSELSLLATDYEALLRPHAAEHGRLFHAMDFDLRAEGRERSNEELLLEAYQGSVPDALMERMWAYGRYLLISSSRRDGQPCHLYGLWCGDYDAVWAFHMVNENMQMIYWQALSGNMPELLPAVFNYMDRHMEDFRTNARKLYGCRGIWIPAPTAPDSGLLKHLSPHIIHWTGGAGWIAQHYYDYYLHTQDREFLRERALPFMREAALFYEDFFVIGEDGLYVSSPSNSPENTPGNYWGGPKTSMGTAVNATMDFAIAKELLTHLVEGAEKAGRYLEEIPKWKEMLRRIPDYQINDDGAVREWMHPQFTDNYRHRHQSHAYPIFPGIEVTRGSDPQLFQAFVTAIEKRLIIGLKEQSGWSLAHMAGNYARMGRGDAALECLEILSRSCVMNNLMTLHNDWRGMGIGVDMDWAPVQLDANMGWSAAVQELLLFSAPGELHLLPALPNRWRTGKAGPLLARGGVLCTLEWDIGTGSLLAALRSVSGGQRVKVYLPPGACEAEGLSLDDIGLTEEPLILKIRLGEPG